MGLRRPTLDDVFLQLTGEPPSENGKPNHAAPGPYEKRMEQSHPPPPVHARSLRDAEAAVTDTAVVTTRNPATLAAARPSRILDDPADHVRRPVRHGSAVRSA
jgi:hypothetical protein